MRWPARTPGPHAIQGIRRSSSIFPEWLWPWPPWSAEMMNSVSRSRPACGDGVQQRRQALVGGADGLELRVRHPAVGVAEVVGIGEVDELDLRAASRRSSAPPRRRPSCRSSRAARTCRRSRGARCAPASSCPRTRPRCRRSSRRRRRRVGTWMKPRSGFHEFQNRPCSLTSKPDSIAACDGSVDARRMVRAFSEYAARFRIASCTGGVTPVSASGRRPSSLMMTTWRIAARTLRPASWTAAAPRGVPRAGRRRARRRGGAAAAGCLRRHASGRRVGSRRRRGQNRR